jgi:hypothetical protein
VGQEHTISIMRLGRKRFEELCLWDWSVWSAAYMSSNAFLIQVDDGLRLIDAGFPGKEAAVFGAIRYSRLPRSYRRAAAIVREADAKPYMSGTLSRCLLAMMLV